MKKILLFLARILALLAWHARYYFLDGMIARDYELVGFQRAGRTFMGLPGGVVVFFFGIFFLGVSQEAEGVVSTFFAVKAVIAFIGSPLLLAQGAFRVVMDIRRRFFEPQFLR